MTKRYVHLPLDEPIGPEERAYWLEEELLEYRGRQVLCLHSKANACRFCDGSFLSHVHTIFIKGYIIRDRYRVAEGSEVISELQPIEGEAERQEVEKILKGSHGAVDIYFE